jgi:signal transduction histidine kinase
MGLAIGAVFLFYAATGVILIDRKRDLTILLVLLTLASVSDVLRSIAEIVAGQGPLNAQQIADAVSLSAAAILEALVFVVAAVVFRQLRSVVLLRDEVIRSKDELIDTISHELRTPLTAVVGYTQLLLDPHRSDVPEWVKEQLVVIKDGTWEMEAVIEDFTVAARAGSGGIFPRSAPVSLRSELDNVLKAVVRSRPHNIEVSVGDEWVLADARFLRQILRNLITNALQHGGEDIQIKASQADGRVDISVWDNGPGVPSKQESLIFQPYWIQIYSTQPNRKGLGLWVSHTIAKRMGGSLTYRRENEGTTFLLQLPNGSSNSLDKATTQNILRKRRRHLRPVEGTAQADA